MFLYFGNEVLVSQFVGCLFILFIVSFAGGSNCKESACNVEIQVQSVGWEDPL